MTGRKNNPARFVLPQVGRGQGRVIALAIFWAGVIGVIVAGLDGEPQRFSVEVWLAVSGSLLVVRLAAGLLRSAGPSSRSESGFTHDSKRVDRTALRRIGNLVGPRKSSSYGICPAGPVAFQALSDLLELSYENERLFVRRLRPRLQFLAAHFLPLRHGVDLVDTTAARRVLGESSWLVENNNNSDQLTGRCPTPADIDRFLSVLLIEPEPKTN